MGGPIVRIGATPEFSKGWDKIFAGKRGAAAKPKAAAAKTKKKPAKKAKKSKK